MLRASLFSLMVCGLAFATESFEELPTGELTRALVEDGEMVAEPEHAEIVSHHARSGAKALHLLGGKDRSVSIELAEALPHAAPLDCYVQRWTRRGGFVLRLSAAGADGKMKELAKLTNAAVGTYGTQLKAMLPAGTKTLLLTADTDVTGGVLLDDFCLMSGKMELRSVAAVNPGPYPLMKRAAVNPVMRLTAETEGSAEPQEVQQVKLHVSPGLIKNVTLRSGNGEGTDFVGSHCYGSAAPAADGSVTIACKGHLNPGETHIWVDAEPAGDAPVGGTASFRIDSVTIDGKETQTASETVTQRIGYLVSVPGEGVGNQPNGAAPRPCVAFRIPGLITTRSGALVGCFDARYKHSGDLCADIDVAVVRSEDGGQTWTNPEVGMDTGVGTANGCGDPCIVQAADGRLWMQALTCHFDGGASLGVSKAGFDEKQTGQWCMVTSDDDGKTWSKDIVNPTRSIKKEEWTCILAGPGRGIVTKAGVIVIPAQIWQNGATPRCMSTLCTSADGGKTWKYGTGIPHATSECQVAELSDGSLMLNCRNERRQGKRIVYVTKDLGKTWTAHESNNKALQEPTCQASLLRTDKGLFLFSNPKAGSRSHMTIRFSEDEGKTWSAGYEYDRRHCWGYSCLTMVDEHTVGVFYETGHASTANGMHGIGFLKMPLEEVLKAK